MATNLQTSPEPSLSSLMTGIVKDVQDLIKQQLALFKHEVGEDFRKTREASTSLVIGLGTLFVAVVMFCLMLVHLLHWAFDPSLALWACYGIVGLGMALIGGALTWWAREQFRSFNPLPDQSLAALKENLEWNNTRK